MFMFRYSRISSLGQKFSSPKPPSLPSYEEDVPLMKGGSCSRPRIEFQLMETFDRIQYALRIKDWICLQEVFEKFDMQREEYKMVHGEVPLLYARALVMLDDQLLTEPAGKKKRKRKRDMSDPDVEALNSIKEKLVRYKELYQDLIRDFRESLDREHQSEEEEEEGCGAFDTDEEEEDKFRLQLELDHSFYRGDRLEPWVKGEDEIAWELVEKKFWDVPRLPGEQKLQHIQELTSLTQAAITPAQKLKFLFDVIKAQLSMKPTLSKPIPIDAWKSCAHNMSAAFDILRRHPNIRPTTAFCEIGPFVYETKKAAGYRGKIRVGADLVEFLTQIYFEFDLSLKFIPPGSQSYQDRLNDECTLLLLFDVYLRYFIWIREYTQAAKVALLYMELVYYRSQAEYDSLLKLVDLAYHGSNAKRPAFPRTCRPLMDILVGLVSKHGDVIPIFQATVCNLYNHALLGNFSDAMHLGSNPNLQAKVPKLGTSIKILYDRATAQLALCAFRAGSIDTAYRLLSELYRRGRIEELLAQGVSHYHFPEKDSEHKMLELMGQTPYHMYIDLELLETVHLVCAMLLGKLGQAMRVHGTEASLTTKSGTQRRVLAASGALKEGDFYKSFELINSLDLWILLENRDNVFEMLKTKMKEEALRNYLITCSYYHSVRLNKLVYWFQLPASEIQRIVVSMMEELRANWDQSGSRILFHNRVEPRSRKPEALRS